MHNPEFQFDHTETENKGGLFIGYRTDTYVDDWYFLRHQARSGHWLVVFVFKQGL